jgi:Phosphatase
VTLVAAAPSREQLLEHVVATRIAGSVATPREGNLANIRKMLAREPEYWFGLELDRDWTYESVLDVLARRVGIDADASHETGADRIEPERCVDALDAMADVLAQVAADRGSVLVATGHPTGLLVTMQQVASALAARGCTTLTPADGEWVMVGADRRRIRFLGGVATVGTGGDLMHTHAPEPMHAVLAALAEPPDLVVGDHGWAGASGQAGIRTVGFADTNDPALFVGAEEGKVEVVVPVDDNVLPRHYVPLTSYLLRHLD